MPTVNNITHFSKQLCWCWFLFSISSAIYRMENHCCGCDIYLVLLPFRSVHFALFFCFFSAALSVEKKNTVSWKRVHNLRDWIYWFIKRLLLPFISTYMQRNQLICSTVAEQYRAKIAIGITSIVLTGCCHFTVLYVSSSVCALLLFVGFLFSSFVNANEKHMNHMQLNLTHCWCFFTKYSYWIILKCNLLLCCFNGFPANV